MLVVWHKNCPHSRLKVVLEVKAVSLQHSDLTSVRLVKGSCFGCSDHDLDFSLLGHCGEVPSQGSGLPLSDRLQNWYSGPLFKKS